MSRSTWQIAVLESGDTYTNSFTMYRPNSDLDLIKASTSAKITLADGTVAFNTPTQASNWEDCVFEFVNIENADTLISNIQNSIDAKEVVRITTHLPSTLIGKFTKIQKKWLIGQTDLYVITVTFSFLSV